MGVGTNISLKSVEFMRFAIAVAPVNAAKVSPKNAMLPSWGEEHKGTEWAVTDYVGIKNAQ